MASVAVDLPRIVGLVATWLLAPILAVWVWRRRGPKLLVLALAFCWLGDVLGNPASLGIGRVGLYLSIGAFVVVNVLLIAVLIRRGRASATWPPIGSRRRRVAILVPYLAMAAAVLAVTGGALAAALLVVGAAYLVLIAVMATVALVVDVRAGIGAALLFGSHLLFVLEVGGTIEGSAPAYRLVVLTLYLLGILLIALGVVRARDRAA